MADLIDLLVPTEQEGSEAVVRAWLKEVGEAVAENEPVVELETDKVAVEVAAPAAGVLIEQVLAVDAEAGPGAVLGRIDTRVAETPSTDLPLRSAGARRPGEGATPAEAATSWSPSPVNGGGLKPAFPPPSAGWCAKAASIRPRFQALVVTAA